jgi:hypothetical protein
VRVRIAYPRQSSRGWAILTIFLIKFIALIPHFIVLAVLAIVAAIVFVIAQIGVLSSGSVPPSLFEFLTGYVRWYTRVYSFILNLTDRYPPFSLRNEPAYPVDVDVEYPERSSKTLAALSLLFVVLGIVGIIFLTRYFADHPPTSGTSWRYSPFSSYGPSNPLAVFRLIMLIPHIIIVGIIGIATFIVWFIVQWVILFVARYPEGMHKFVSQWLGWSVRIGVYSNGLTDRYPPFTLETVDWGPLAGTGGQAPTAAGPPPPPPPPPSPPAAGDTWVDDRFSPPSPGEGRTAELPPTAPESQEPRPQAPTAGREAPPQPPAGGQEPPPQPPAEGQEPPAEPPAGAPRPPTPPQAPPPPPAPH